MTYTRVDPDLFSEDRMIEVTEAVSKLAHDLSRGLSGQVRTSWLSEAVVDSACAIEALLWAAASEVRTRETPPN